VIGNGISAGRKEREREGARERGRGGEEERGKK
jgi:hypothetical protein